MPRILTNKHNLPETIIKALTYDTHKMGGGADISVTTLIDAPQIRQLKRAHTYEEDAADMIAALLGTALHHILERANIASVELHHYQMVDSSLDRVLKKKVEEKNEAAVKKLKAVKEWFGKFVKHEIKPEGADDVMQEQNFTVTVDDYTISGTADLYWKKLKRLGDYKSCGVYMFMNEEAREKWIHQANIYAHMLRKNGYPVHDIEFIAFIKDFSKMKARIELGYPKAPIQTLSIPLWTEEETESYLRERIRLHKLADTGVQIECTDKERWSRATVYAVIKDGNKRSTKNFEVKENAEAYVLENNPSNQNKLKIVERPGEPTKCLYYCPVSEVCPQHAKYMKSLC